MKNIEDSLSALPFSEDQYFFEYKRISNKFRKYNSLSVLRKCIEYLHHPTKDKLEDLQKHRVFFGIGKGKDMRVDGGHIDLRVEFVDKDRVTGAIITELPENIALSNGDSIEVFEDEILYKAEYKDH